MFGFSRVHFVPAWYLFCEKLQVGRIQKDMKDFPGYSCVLLDPSFSSLQGFFPKPLKVNFLAGDLKPAKMVRVIPNPNLKVSLAYLKHFSVAD